MKEIKINISNLNLFYGNKSVLKNINLEIRGKKITALIGPSGCGKTSLLRSINRMNDYIPGCRIEGRVEIDSENIFEKDVDVYNLRQKVGIVSQKPNLFPKSIFDNLAFVPRLKGIKKREDLLEIVEIAATKSAIWDEIKDRLSEPALNLSMGQQQRVCIARTLAASPEILLMDEPTTSLDPVSTSKIEQLIYELKNDFTIVIVTHIMQQAGRISDFTAFMYDGEIVEYNSTTKIFTKPAVKKTEDYVTGRFGN
ncbi:MAG: phosphate ABC transporter ATP-binding protein [Ignavibacteriaceae bacterium]|nr:phosphate ABC transporter ATP-binding protein [Ignavibacteriaceae bacterium]